MSKCGKSHGTFPDEKVFHGEQATHFSQLSEPFIWKDQRKLVCNGLLNIFLTCSLSFMTLFRGFKVENIREKLTLSATFSNVKNHLFFRKNKLIWK